MALKSMRIKMIGTARERTSPGPRDSLQLRHVLAAGYDWADHSEGHLCRPPFSTGLICH